MKTGIRIASGRLRNHVLTIPSGIRPTASRVRESLLDIWRPRLEGARFLDLFAGSGAVGIEAVSRGASPLVMVDSEPLVVQQLLDTCRSLDLRGVRVQSAGLPEDLFKDLPNLDGEFDLIFADPPYAFDAYAELLEAAVDRLSPTGEIAVEHESRRQLLGPYRGILGVDQRRYGDSCLSFFQRDPEIQG